MDILITGTGALATLFAARLSRAGHQVTLLGSWPAGLEALQKNGARLIEHDGSESACAVQATADPAQCRGAKFALVLVKAWQTARVARQLAECLSEDGVALTLQNGLGNRETLIAELGDPRVALGVTTSGATLLGPGLARAGGEGILSVERHPAIGPLVDALRSAQFQVEIVAEARSLIWGKLVINAAINPLTALLRVPNGELLKRPSAQNLMHALAKETAAVAHAESVPLPFADPAQAAEDVALKTASNHSSMLQDVLRGAPTEIDAICGAIVRYGQKHGVPTPVNQVCWQLIKAISP
ncbi:MAG: ketopantoate reductase family protein [Anaerolineae bacterium]